MVNFSYNAGVREDAQEDGPTGPITGWDTRHQHGGRPNMEVSGLSSARPMSPVSRPETTAAPAQFAPVGPVSPKDEVEISAVGKLLDDASRTPGIREQRLAEIKAAIEAGTYETPEKLEMAINRMVDQVKLDDR